jgi:regulator of protease activity HflC (stomatin/prohibitin superfamily)
MKFILYVILGLVLLTFRKSTTGKYQIIGFSVSSIVNVLMILFFTLAGFQCLVVVPAGNVGVIDFFGTVSNRILKSGINFVNPLARVVMFSIKTHEVKEEMDVPTKEGLAVHLEVSVLYHLNPEKAAEVYKTLGLNYPEIILAPQFRSVTRGVTASFESKALYTSEREMLSQMISKDLEMLVSPRGIEVETIPLRRVALPERLQGAIQEKLEADQESQRMQFVLQKERQEAERKRIEAQGISDFQKIVTSGISDQLLRWKGIEATEKLAASANAKVVIIGAGKDGLPLILDTAK